MTAVEIEQALSGRLNKRYVELLKKNPAWASAERRADMNNFMARFIFCFFVEDTGIFNGQGLFTQTLQQFTAHATIAGLYDPQEMPDNLRAAHAHNNEVLERIYIGQRFKNGTERLEKLFALYTQMPATATKPKPAAKAARGRRA